MTAGFGPVCFGARPRPWTLWLVGLVSCGTNPVVERADGAPETASEVTTPCQEVVSLDSISDDQFDYLALTPLDRAAIGRFDVTSSVHCTAFLVGRFWALSVRHCAAESDVGSSRVEFANNDVRTVTRVVLAEEEDLALLELDSETQARPFALSEDAPIVGSVAETIGFGVTTESAPTAARESVVTIEAVNATIQTNAWSRTGPCMGDSGAPLIVRDSHGQVRVAGLLTSGDDICSGRDEFARLDKARAWLDEALGELPEPNKDCSALTERGRCFGSVSVWCRDGSLEAEECGSIGCGWDERSEAFRCRDSNTEVCSADDVGFCEDNVAVRCNDSLLERIDCRGCFGSCDVAPALARVACGK